MCLFKKSLLGANCNRLYDFDIAIGKKYVPFSCYGRIKENSAGKCLNIANTNTKADPPNCQIGLPINSSFL